MAQNVISDELKFKIFLGGMPPRPPSLSCLSVVAELSLTTSSIHKSLPDQSKIASDAPAEV